ncbi:MAG TPA: hypothetical protein VHL50_09770, partial [Pyrinomonadaceae bacterium]|nr:hypothetical protein [Pyrinomonadaceae bacterium]
MSESQNPIYSNPYISAPAAATVQLPPNGSAPASSQVDKRLFDHILETMLGAGSGVSDLIFSP